MITHVPGVDTGYMRNHDLPRPRVRDESVLLGRGVDNPAP